MKKLIPLLLLLTGCASVNYHITDWDNDSDKVKFDNGKQAHILGNPPITCYTKYGFKLTEGYFVAIKGEYLEIDEYGKDFVYLQSNDLGNFCILGEQK